MYLAIFGFLQMSFADILDILLLALLIFILFKWIRGSSAMSIFIAIISLYFVRILVSAFCLCSWHETQQVTHRL